MKFSSCLRLFLIPIIVIFLTMPVSVYALIVDISANVTGCGDGLIGVGEQCDGAELGGASCFSLGFNRGNLSCTNACTLNASACVANNGGGGGGGGGGGIFNIPTKNVVFSGRAYPLSKVTILKDGQVTATTIAGPDSNFSVSISGLSTGTYLFAVYGQDSAGVRSSLFTFSIYITSGVTTKIGGIFIAPTISVDKSEVRKGDTVTIFGQSIPDSDITISVHSDEEFFLQKTSDNDGVYLAQFDTSVLEVGSHSTKSKATFDTQISPYGKSVGFTVGTKNVIDLDTDEIIRSDSNSDGRVNLVDFSILSYWFNRSNPPTTVDLNDDKKVDLVDFSIMAFHWTG